MTALVSADIESKVLSLESNFNKINAYQVNFKRESHFALQILKGNDFLLKTAKAKPESLEAALMNIAAIGITLNPALKEAYLVPRGSQVCLDISYLGLVKLATETGSVIWVQAEIVKEKDSFKYMGVGKMPTHEFNPFGDRGAMVGVYCIAKLHTGEFLTTVMSKEEVEDIRNKSSQASKSGPWVTFFEEMSKKTVIKRASKLWPKSERVQQAVEILNEHEGVEFSSEKTAFIPEASSDMVANESTFKNLRALLVANNKKEDALLKYINTQFKSEITSIDEMSPEMLEASYRAMGGR